MSEAKKNGSLKVKPRKGAEANKSPVLVSIDYPQLNETVRVGHYAVRISGPAHAKVEVSINGGTWQTCRQADGYYWFDWWPNDAGEFRLAARINGQIEVPTAERRSKVVAHNDKKTK